MKARIKNLLTGEIVECIATTDHPASSYGKAVWVTKDGEALGQIDLPLVGMEIIEQE